MICISEFKFIIAFIVIYFIGFIVGSGITKKDVLKWIDRILGILESQDERIENLEKELKNE